MKQKTFVINIVVIIALASVVFAGIPEPDITLYGTVAVNNVPKGAGDNVTINARVSGVASPVGSYPMGDNVAAGDNYVIKIAVDTLTDGSGLMMFLGTSTPAIGETVTLYATENGGPEVAVGSYVITSRGITQQLDLTNGPFLDTDFNTDGKTNFKDFSTLAQQWQETNCSELNEWCNGVDFDHLNGVDISDLLHFVDDWMAGVF